MITVQLSLEIPGGPWIGEISRRYPDAIFRVFAAIPTEEHGYALVKIVSDDVNAVLEEMDQHPSITEMSILHTDEDLAVVHFQTTMPLLLRVANQAGIPITMPFTVQNGTITLDLTGSEDRLLEFGSLLDQHGFSFEITRIHHDNRYELLTEKQEKLLKKAVDSGYYDTPRKCTLTELAEELGMAKSTCSEMLHRCEEIIIKEFLEGGENQLDSGVVKVPK